MSGRWLCIVNSHTLTLFNRGGYDDQGMRVVPPHNSQSALLGAIHQNSLETAYTVHHMVTKDTHGTITFETFLDKDKKFMFLIMLGSKISGKPVLYVIHDSKCIINAIRGLMDLVLGQLSFDDMHNVNVETFKKRLRATGSIFERILNIKNPVRIELLVSLPRHVLCTQQTHALKQTALEKLYKESESWGSNFGAALFVQKKFYIATDEWYSNDTDQLAMIGLYLSLQTDATSRDIPIHLKQGNIRMVTVQLVEDIELCVLCGSKPSMYQIVHSVREEAYDYVAHLTKLKNPIHIREDLKLDDNLLAIIFVNRSEYPFFIYENFVENQEVEELIGEFYVYVSTKMFNTHRHLNQKEPVQRNVHQSYMKMKEYGLCAIRQGKKELYCIYNQQVPTYALVGLTVETMNSLLEAK